MKTIRRAMAFALAILLILSMGGLTAFADIGDGAGMAGEIGTGAVPGLTGNLPGGDPGLLPPAPTPNAVFDGIQGVLKDFTPGDVYSLDGTAWLPADALAVLPVTEGETVILVKTPASAVNSESLPQSIMVLKPPAPVGVSAVSPANSSEAGSITGMNSAMEYCGPDGVWKQAPDGAVTGLAPGGYQVRGKGGDNILPGDVLSLTIIEFQPVREPKPSAVFDASSMTLSNLPERARYSVDGGATFVQASGSAVLTGVTAADGILVYVQGDGSTTEDSEIQTIAVTKPAAPAVTAVDAQGEGGLGAIRGVDASMEYRAAGGAWQPVSGAEIAGLPAGDYEVRYKARGTALAGDPAEVKIQLIKAAKMDKPNAVFEASTMLLSNLPATGRYSLDGGVSWTSASGSVLLSGVTPAHGIRVKAAGDGKKTLDSDAQIIGVTKPGRPSAVAVNPSVIGGTGALSNVDGRMQYCPTGSGSWQDIGGSQVTGLTPGSYDVRYKAGGNSLAGDPQTVVIEGFGGKKAETPAAVFDASTMRLSGLRSGMLYSVDGGAGWLPAGEGFAELSNVSAAAGIRVKTAGDGSKTLDSDIQVITLTQAQPPAVHAENPDRIGGRGRIVNVNHTMQYRREGIHGWTDIGSDTVNDLEAGRYEVRVKGSGTVLASAPATVEIGSAQGRREEKPSASFNAQNHVLSGMKTGMRYSTDGGHNYERAEKDGDIDLSGRNVTYKNDIHVYMPGNGVDTVDSEIQVIDIRQQPAPSGVRAVNATTQTKTGSLTGVDSSMEYKAESAKDWIRVTGDTVKNLAPGVYQVRTQGKYASVASEPITVKIELTQAPIAPAVKPAPAPAAAPPAALAPQKQEEKKEAAKTEEEKERAAADEKKDSDESGSGGTQKVSPENAPEGTPIVSGDKPAAGWEEIDHLIGSADSSATTVVDMNGATELPAGTINSLKESAGKLIMDMGDGVCWAVAGETVESTAFKPVDLKVTRGDSYIPKELVKAAEEETQSLSSTQFEIAHSGSLGFAAILAMNVGADYSQKTANLFYYDEAASELKLQDTKRIDEEGNVSYVFGHASSYVITVSEQAYTKAKITAGAGGQGIDDQKAQPSAEADIKPDEGKQKSKAPLIIIVIAVTLLAAGGIFLVVNKNKFLDS